MDGGGGSKTRVPTMILAAPQQGLENLEADGVVVDREDPHPDGELVPLPPRDHALLLHPRGRSAQKHPAGLFARRRKSEQRETQLRAGRKPSPQPLGSKPQARNPRRRRPGCAKLERANARQKQGRGGRTRPAQQHLMGPRCGRPRRKRKRTEARLGG
jgi:hypothetical protein